MRDPHCARIDPGGNSVAYPRQRRLRLLRVEDDTRGVRHHRQRLRANPQRPRGYELLVASEFAVGNAVRARSFLTQPLDLVRFVTGEVPLEPIPVARVV